MGNVQLQNQINQAKAAGYNDSDIKSFLSQKGFNLNGTQYEGGVKGFIGRNLSTIGSVALPAIADVATGGLAIPADAALSAVGSGAGKVASNELEGQKATAGVGGATEQGAVGGLLGGTVGKLVGKAGGVASGAIDKAVTDKTTQAAAEKTAEAVAPFAPLNKTVLSDNDLKGTMDLFKNKINMDPTTQNMHKAASIVTSENGVVSGIMHDVLAKAGKVDVGDVGQAAKSAINSVENSPILGDASTKGTPGNNLFNSVINQKENGLLGGTGGGITKAGEATGKIQSKADAPVVFKNIQTLDKQIRGLSSAEPGTVGHSTKNVLQAVKGHLEDKLYNDAGVNKIVADTDFGKAPGASQAAVEHEVLRNGGTPELADHIINGINSVQTGQDLRGLQAPFVRADNLATAADTHAAGKGVVQDAASAVKGTPDDSGLGDAAHLGASVAVGSHLGLANTLTNLVKRGATSDKVLNPLSKASDIAGKVNDVLPGKGKLSNLVANTAGQTVARAGSGQTNQTGSVSADNLATTGTPTTGQPTTPQFSQQDLEEAVLADPKNASTYEALYTALGKPQNDLTTNQQNELTGAQNAKAALQSYASTLGGAGGGSGPLGGSVEQLLGKYGIGGNTAATAYAIEQGRGDTAASVAAALTPTGKPSAALIKMISASLPTAEDTPDVVQAKLSKIENTINSTMQTETEPVNQIAAGV